MTPRYCLGAVEDLTESADWLNRRKPGDGDRLVDVFEAAVLDLEARLSQAPRFEVALEQLPDREIRRLTLKPFPHLLLFEVKGDHAVIWAVMHPSPQSCLLVSATRLGLAEGD